MRRWFLSYNSQDLALMHAFEAALRRKDADARFFFAPKSLRAGGFWLPKLAQEIAEVIGALATTPDKLPIVLGNSGVGKSWIAQAGVLAALMGQAWPETVEAAGRWPQAFSESRHWCFLRLKPGTEPVRALIEPFL